MIEPVSVLTLRINESGVLRYALQPWLARGRVKPTTIMIDSSTPKRPKSSRQ